MRRRILLGLLGFAIAAQGSIAGYAWWTRRGAPSFERGGAFGPTPTLSAASSHSVRPTASATQAGATVLGVLTTGPRSSLAAKTIGPSQTPAAGSGAVMTPRPGTYAYRGSGSEHVDFGGLSACGWDLKSVSVAVKESADGWVFDTTYSSSHQEREILRYQKTGIYTTYVGAAVTCMGFRKTTNDDYAPAARRIAMPLAVGSSWSGSSRAGQRTEAIRGTVLRHTTLVVPAGRFDAYEIHLGVTLSGSETGTYDTTIWFAPALDVDLQRTVKSDVHQGSAHYSADYTISLSSLP